jgi:SAM-dependent methyltransferase
MSPDTPYTTEYFEAQDYARTMLETRMVNGSPARPLAEAAVDMVEAVWPREDGAPARLFDVGCALGYVVQEATKRGWTAKGMDLSREVIDGGPVSELLTVGDATKASIEDCDVSVCLNVFEHLTAEEAIALGRNLASHSQIAITVINKSDHDPTHVTLKSNRWWIRHLQTSGLAVDWPSTFAARAAYLRSGNWNERWWADCLVFRGSGMPPRGRVRAALSHPPLLLRQGARAARRKLRRTYEREPIRSPATADRSSGAP